MDRGQALGYARALWAGAWARSLVPQALIPSLSGSGDTLFSLSWKSRHLPPLCVGLSGNGWVRGGGAGRCGPAPCRDPTDPAGLMKHQRKPSHLWLCGRHSGRSVALVVVVSHFVLGAAAPASAFAVGAAPVAFAVGAAACVRERATARGVAAAAIPVRRRQGHGSRLAAPNLENSKAVLVWHLVGMQARLTACVECPARAPRQTRCPRRTAVRSPSA